MRNVRPHNINGARPHCRSDVTKIPFQELRTTQPRSSTHDTRSIQLVASPTDHEPYADELIAEFIFLPDGHESVAEARVARYGVPVWALIGYLPAANGDLGMIAEAYQLPLDAVLAAFAFYARHRTDIDARIAANAAGIR